MLKLEAGAPQEGNFLVRQIAQFSGSCPSPTTYPPDQQPSLDSQLLRKPVAWVSLGPLTSWGPIALHWVHQL